MRATSLLPILLPLLAATAGADKIHLVDGKILEKITVLEESYKELTYRGDGARRETVPAEKILRVSYGNLPQLLDRAESAASQGQLLEAINDYETYVAGAATDRTRRPDWATPYAAFRLVELNRLIGDADGVIAAADKLLAAHPRSRYVPATFQAKAQAQAAKGEHQRAERTLAELIALVDNQELSQRWKLEAQLSRILLDPELPGPQKREALIEISSKAGREFPTVRNRADVAEAEVLLASRSPDDAEKIFRRVVDDLKADSATLAAAYTGLGDVLYQRAAGQSGEAAKKSFQGALLAYMRVVVNHPDEVEYVPKALFYAGRSFDQIGAEDARDNSRKLYLAIVRQYPGSNWASEARGFLR